MDESIGKLVISVGFIIMLIQHFCLILIPFILPSLTVQIFYIDILGILIVSIGYFLAFIISNKNKFYFLGAGICFLMWDICTIIWRIITNFYDITLNSADSSATITNFFQQVVAQRFIFSIFSILAGLFLFIASILIFKAHGGSGTVMLVTFSLINFIGVILISAPVYLLPESQVTNASNLALGVILGLILKVVLVPIFGLIAFLILSIKTNDITIQ